MMSGQRDFLCGMFRIPLRPGQAVRCDEEFERPGGTVLSLPGRDGFLNESGEMIVDAGFPVVMPAPVMDGVANNFAFYHIIHLAFIFELMRILPREQIFCHPFFE